MQGVPHRVSEQDLHFAIKNVSDDERTLHITRTSWADDIVTAADVTAMQEFRTLFGSEVLAPGAEFSIRNMVFLFSDVVESTAMYERVGDAKAFALVRDHFDVMEEVYSKHRGALVKTIGDAVMAVFRHPEDALQAALEMHYAAQEMLDEQGERPIALKIGLHAGPCIAMQANGKLDYFGTTVNKAARVQGVAKAHEVAVSQELINSTAAQTWFALHGLEPEEKSHNLKGLAGNNKIYFVRVERAPKANTREIARAHLDRVDRSSIYGRMTTIRNRPTN